MIRPGVDQALLIQKAPYRDQIYFSDLYKMTEYTYGITVDPMSGDIFVIGLMWFDK